MAEQRLHKGRERVHKVDDRVFEAREKIVFTGKSRSQGEWNGFTSPVNTIRKPVNVFIDPVNGFLGALIEEAVVSTAFLISPRPDWHKLGWGISRTGDRIVGVDLRTVPCV